MASLFGTDTQTLPIPDNSKSIDIIEVKLTLTGWEYKTDGFKEITRV